MSILGFYWIIFEILWYVSGREFISVLSSINPTVSALESYRSDSSPPCSLFSIHPVGGLSGDWGLEQYQTPGRFPPSLCYLHPLFILYTWQPAKQSCTIGLHSRHSQSLFLYFHPSIVVCASVSLSLSSFLFPCCSSHSSLPWCLKIEAGENLKVMDTWRHSSGNLRGTAEGE